jgi:hypothetical protein
MLNAESTIRKSLTYALAIDRNIGYSARQDTCGQGSGALILDRTGQQPKWFSEDSNFPTALP